MFFNFEPKRNQTHNVIEMEDIDFEDIDPPTIPQPAPQKEIKPVQFRIEKNPKNALGRAAKLTINDTKVKPVIESNEQKPLFTIEQKYQKTQQEPAFTKHSINSPILSSPKTNQYRAETEINVQPKNKIQGRLLGNLSSLAPKPSDHIDVVNNQMNPNIPSRKRVQENLAENKTDAAAPLIPRRKMMSNNDDNLFSADVDDLQMPTNSKKPKGKLLNF